MKTKYLFAAAAALALVGQLALPAGRSSRQGRGYNEKGEAFPLPLVGMI